MINEFIDRQAVDEDLYELEDVQTGEKRQYRIVSKATVTQEGTALSKATFDPILEEINGKVSKSCWETIELLPDTTSYYPHGTFDYPVYLTKMGNKVTISGGKVTFPYENEGQNLTLTAIPSDWLPSSGKVEFVGISFDQTAIGQPSKGGFVLFHAGTTGITLSPKGMTGYWVDENYNFTPTYIGGQYPGKTVYWSETSWYVE